MTYGRAAFERAVVDYRLTDLAPPERALAIAAASLERTGLFLLGETHGVAQTPLAILGLASRLDVRALAFEWSYDELDDVVQPVLATGKLASDALWNLPASAEVFSGDGRFTAGHVRLLEHLGGCGVATTAAAKRSRFRSSRDRSPHSRIPVLRTTGGGRLDRIVLLDRVGSDGSEREAGMALRLLAGRRVGSPLLAVLGVAHVVREPLEGVAPMGLLVDQELPGVATGILVPSSGTCWFHGVQAVRSRDLPPADAVIPIGEASPAAVPRRGRP